MPKATSWWSARQLSPFCDLDWEWWILCWNSCLMRPFITLVRIQWFSLHCCNIFMRLNTFFNFVFVIAGMYHISGQPPVQYFNRLPRKCESDIAYVLDPVVATAATIMSVVAVLKKVGFICSSDASTAAFVMFTIYPPCCFSKVGSSTNSFVDRHCLPRGLENSLG